MLPVSALAALPDFYRTDAVSELMSVLQSLKSFLPPSTALIHIGFSVFPFSFLSSYSLDVLFCKVLIEFSLRPVTLSVQEVFVRPIVPRCVEERALFSTTMVAPKTRTQILLLAHQGGAAVRRAASENTEA